jgi:hypothetical protein
MCCVAPVCARYSMLFALLCPLKYPTQTSSTEKTQHSESHGSVPYEVWDSIHTAKV